MVHISLAAEKIFSIGSFYITNTLLTSWLVMIFLVVVAILVSRRLTLVPTGVQNVVEMIIDGLLSFMIAVAGSRKNAERFFPIVATIFFFVLFANWAGIVPGVGSIGLQQEVLKDGHFESVFVPLFRSAYSDLNLTLALALIAISLSHFFGLITVGVGAHLGKFFNFKGPIDFFVGILEFVSEFAKIVSFTFRLFGNIFAGEVVLVIMTFLVPIVVPVPFYGLELFVGFIQALIFSVLTMMFLVVATQHHEITEKVEN
jgi:F-type H+-transporting ATPase subunit a